MIALPVSRKTLQFSRYIKMMKRINLIELFVLVVISEFSIATPPMMSSCASLLAPIHTYDMPLSFTVQSQSTGTKEHESAMVNVRTYLDDTGFDYTLMTSKKEQVLRNRGKNTDIVYFYGTKMQFYVKGNANVLYNLDFEQPSAATTFANYIVKTTPARYKKCQGSHTYKIDLLYNSTRAAGPFRLGEMVHEWCIFKERKGNVTTFMIKWIGPASAHLDPFGVFRSTDYKLERVSGADNKLELSILFNRVPLGPKYILETPTPQKLEAFLK